jgi:hypothetical protein
MKKKLALPVILFITLIPLILIQKDSGSKKISQINQIETVELTTIYDDQDTFYGSIDTYVSENDDVVILDRGNHRAIVYDLNGDKRFEFSKEGSGPGEFSSTTFDVQATSKYLVFVSNSKMMVYSYSQELLAELPGNFHQEIVPILKDDFMEFYYMPNKGAKYLSAKYSYSGQFISGVERTYDDRIKYDPSTWEGYLNNFKDIYRQKMGFTPFAGKFLRIHQLDYEIFISDLNGKIEKTIKREVERIKLTKDDFWEISDDVKNGLSQTELENLTKNYNKANSLKLEISGGFKRDIKQIVGTIDDRFAFFWVSSKNKDEILLDVYDSNFEYYSQIKIQEKCLNWAKVANGKLVCEYKNDVDGFYFKIFDLIFTQNS